METSRVTGQISRVARVAGAAAFSLALLLVAVPVASAQYVPIEGFSVDATGRPRITVAS